MSLDVYLKVDAPVPRAGPGSGIFIREKGRMREITRAEWDERAPRVEPVVSLPPKDELTTTVFSSNITHNLGKMAAAAGIYHFLWQPGECEVSVAAQLIEPLQAGLQKLRAAPEQYEAMNPKNGWGNYDGLVDFVEGYLAACKRWPDAKVETWA